MAVQRKGELVVFACGFTTLIVCLLTYYMLNYRDVSRQIVDINQRVELLHSMRLELAGVSEAQNCAVLAASDIDAKRFVAEAAITSEKLRANVSTLEQLMHDTSDDDERKLWVSVQQSLQNFFEMDRQLSELASQNTNAKANELALGPALELLGEIEQVLEQASPVATDQFGADPVVSIGSQIIIAALHIQVTLLPHIAEAEEARMDEFERQIAKQFETIDQRLIQLEQVRLSWDATHQAKLAKLISQLHGVTDQIIKLSRQNTEIRAIKLALNERRSTMLACQDSLLALEKSIRTEPVGQRLPSGRTKTGAR